MDPTGLPMRGKTCLITGATRGLGQAAALQLAHMGAKVVIAGRSPARIQHTLASLQQAAPDTQPEGLLADLSSLADVRALAQQFLAMHNSLDVLINNVGATILTYQASVNGFEMTWALNSLGHFLLTHLLLDALKSTAAETGQARILEISSNMYRLSDARFDRFQTQTGYNGVRAYAQSKRAVNMFVCALTNRLKGSGVTANAVTPGLVKTGVAVNNRGWAQAAISILHRFALPVEEGVQPIVRLASDPTLRGFSGQYYVKYQPARLDPACLDPRALDHLWQISQQMTGLAS